MKITKVFNNNVVLVAKDDHTELVMMGRGLAFQKRAGEQVELSKVEKTFVLETKGLSEKLADLIREIPLGHLEISDDIIQFAKNELHADFSDNIYLALTDHISFALSRVQHGLSIKNALFWEIKKFYKKEFEVALNALDIIERGTGVRLPEDEAGSIALHFVNAQQGDQGVDQTLTITKIVNDILNIVKYHYGIELDENSMNYSRFITHIRYFAYRLLRNEIVLEEEDSLYDQVKHKYPEAYRCAEKVKSYLQKNYVTNPTKEEMVYFMLHIHRVTSREQKNN